MESFKGNFFVKWMFLIQLIPCTNQAEDYWSDDFDPNQNCKHPELIRNLMIMEPSQCKQVIATTVDKEAFRGDFRTQNRVKLGAIPTSPNPPPPHVGNFLKVGNVSQVLPGFVFRSLP